MTKHGRVLLCIAHNPGVRLRDIAATVGITERSAYGIVSGLAAVGYAVKRKDGRRNRYQIQAHLPLPEPAGQQLTIGEVLALLAGASGGDSRSEETCLRSSPPPTQQQLSREALEYDHDLAPRA